MKAVDLAKLLPADVPAGERILWHGRPDALSLARRAFRADFVLAYFVALAAWNFVSFNGEQGWLAGATSATKTLGIGAAALALLGFLAWLSARTTVYIITSRRLVFKIGIALPIFINLPFSQIDSAAARVFADGTADIPVGIVGGQRVAYLALWPHARPLHFNRPQPTLRGIADGAAVADTLSRALLAASGGEARREDAVPAFGAEGADSACRSAGRRLDEARL